MTDDQYAAAVDNGSYSRDQFCHDSAGMGLAQWTQWSRKQGLQDLAKAKKVSIGDLNLQLEYLMQELKTSYPSLLELLKTTTSIKDASDAVLTKFERPANMSDENMERRASYGYEFQKELMPQKADKDPVETVVSLALSQVGYKEKASNSQLDDFEANAGHNNWTKYARDLDTLGDVQNGRKQAQDWCLTAGTLILTDKGYKNIEDIEVGDKVVNAYGTAFNDVLQVSFHESSVIDIRAYGSLPMSVTKNHRFLSQKRIDKSHRNKGYKEYGFNEIQNLNKNDVIVYPKSPILYDNILSYDDLWTLGYYVGDGFFSNNRYILCGNKDKDKEIEKHVGARRECDYDSRTCSQYVLHSTGKELLFAALKDCGVGAVNKQVPKCVMFGSKEVKTAFLDGYMAADGCSSMNSYSTVSKKLALGITKLWFDLGIPVSIVIQNRPPYGQIFDKRLNAYRTFKQQEKIYNCYLNPSTDKKHQFCTSENGVMFVPLKDKSEEEHIDTVYTITVGGDNTFTANNLAVHNCDVFVDWLFVTSFGKDLGTRMIYQPLKGLGAGVGYSARYYKNNNAYYSSPQVGDQIFFGDGDHTGIVVGVTSATVTTVEGNYSDRVSKNTFKLTDSWIAGYGRPNWALAGSVKPQPTPTPQPTPVTPSDAETYTVKSGDTLGKIAQAYSTTVDTLVKLNGISNPNLIFVGQVIKLPKKEEVKPTPTPTPAPTPAPAPKPTPAPTPSEPTEVTQIVKAGDTLGEIADKYDVTVDALVKANNIANPNLIYVNQKLIIPGKKQQETKPTPTTGRTYTVVSGDTLGRIAQKYGTTVDALAKLNDIANVNLIYVGQVLKID